MNYNLDFVYRICYLGDRLLTSALAETNGVFTCSKDNYTTLYATHCFNNTCDDYFSEHNTRVVDGIPGLGSGVFHGQFKKFW